MKKILNPAIIVLVFLGLNIFAAPVKPAAKVNDYAGILSGAEQSYLTSIINTFEEKTTVEIAVVTVKSLEGETVEKYANDLFNKMGIGKKGKNNGVLFLVALDEKKIRFETGYGIEPVLTDGTCGEIRDKYVIPYFKQGDYAAGIREGTKAVIKTISGALGKESDITPKSAKSEEGINPGIIIVLFFLFVIFSGIFFPGRSKNYRNRGGWSSGGFSGGSGGGFGGGFGGGGGGGFGGGSSGGGGAGGSW